MLVGVLGGTGALGRQVVTELERRGHRAAVLSRSAGERPELHRRVDVTTGQGLDGALSDLEVLVDVLQGPAPVLVDGLSRALAAAKASGVRAVVSISILGADRVPLGYYRVKIAQEAAVQSAGVPWSILRATQFHSSLDTVFTATARRGVLPMLRVPLQPVAPEEVASRLVDLVEVEPAGITRLAGPRVQRADHLARIWARARGVRWMPVPVPAVGPMLRAVRGGGLTDPSAPTGRVSFQAWLKTAA
jgi:uncharacterized protein YbjT (DUF2867 family)